MRVATIDIGTNTVLLLVAERGPTGELEVVAERATVTRLGEGVDRTRQLAPAAIARTLTCLQEYGDVVQRLAPVRVAVVGTSAMRDASGGEQITAAVRTVFGVEAQVIAGAEEARLTFRGSLSGLGRAASSDVAVFDIGGGSTEVVLGQVNEGSDAVSWAESFDVGSVRLTERHGEDRIALERAAATALAGVPALPEGCEIIGCAGTMTTLAAVSLRLATYDGGRVHGHVLTLDELRRVVAELAALELPARRRVPGMEPARADVIVAGGVLALTLLQLWRGAAVRVSDRGVRWGLAEELAARGAPPQPTPAEKS